MKPVRQILLILLLLSFLCDSRGSSLYRSHNRSDHQGKVASPTRPAGYGTLKISDEKYDTPYTRKIVDRILEDVVNGKEDFLHYGPRDIRSLSENTSQNFLKNETSRFHDSRIPRWILHRQHTCHSARCKSKVTSTRQNSDGRRYGVRISSDIVRERTGDEGMVFEQIKEALKHTLPLFGRLLIHFGKFSKDEIAATEDPNVDDSLFVGYLSRMNTVKKFKNQSTLAPDFLLKDTENIAGTSNDPFSRLGYDTTMKDGNITVSPMNYLDVKNGEENLTTFYKNDFEEKSYQMDIKSNIPATETLVAYRDAKIVVGSGSKFPEHSANLTKIGDDNKYTIPSQGNNVTESDTVESIGTEVVGNESKLAFVSPESFNFAEENSSTEQVNKVETQIEANMRQDDVDNLNYRTPNKNTLKDAQNDSLLETIGSCKDENNETELNKRNSDIQTHRHEEIWPVKCTNGKKLKDAEMREVIYDALIKAYSEYKKLVEEFLNTIPNKPVLTKISENQTFGFENGAYEVNSTSRMKSTGDLNTNSQLLYEIIKKLVHVSKWNDIFQAQNNEIQSNNSDSGIQTHRHEGIQSTKYNFSEIPSILHEFYNVSIVNYFEYNSQPYTEFLENKTYVFGNSPYEEENSTSEMTLNSTKGLENISMLLNETSRNMEAVSKIGSFFSDKHRETEANNWHSDIETFTYADIQPSKYVEFRGATYQIIAGSPSALNSTYSVSLIRKWIQKSDTTPEIFSKNNTYGDFLFTPNIPEDNSTTFIDLYDDTTDFSTISAPSDVPDGFKNFQVLKKMNDSRVLFEQTEQSNQSSVTVNDTFVKTRNGLNPVNESEKISLFENKLIPKISEENLTDTAKLLDITPKKLSTTYFNSSEDVEHVKSLTGSQSGMNETDIPVNNFQTNPIPLYISHSTGFTLNKSETELRESPEISFEEKSEILYKNNRMEEAISENSGNLTEELTNKVNNIPSTIPDYGSTEKETGGSLDHATLFEVSSVISPSTPVIEATKPISNIEQNVPQNNMHITKEFPKTANEHPETYVVRTIAVVNNNTGKITYHEVNVSKHILEEDNYDNLTEYEKYIVFLREYYTQNYVQNRRGKRFLTRTEYPTDFRRYFSKSLMMHNPPHPDLVYANNRQGKRFPTRMEFRKDFESYFPKSLMIRNLPLFDVVPEVVDVRNRQGKWFPTRMEFRKDFRSYFPKGLMINNPLVLEVVEHRSKSGIDSEMNV